MRCSAHWATGSKCSPAAATEKKNRSAPQRSCVGERFLRIFHRDADLGDELFRVVCKAVVDEGDLTRKSGNAQAAFGDEAEQPPVLPGRLQVVAVEAHADAACFRQCERFALDAVGAVEHEKRAIVLLEKPGLQMLARHAEADLAEEDERFRLRGDELARRELEVGVVLRGQRGFYPEKAAGGRCDELDRAERGALHLAQLAQPRVDLALDELQLALLQLERGLLRAQLLLDGLYIAVLQKICDLAQRHIERAQIPDGVERLKLPRAEVAIARGGVNIFGGDQAECLIMAQAAHAEMEKRCDFADRIKLRMNHAIPPGRAARGAG